MRAGHAARALIIPVLGKAPVATYDASTFGVLSLRVALLSLLERALDTTGADRAVAGQFQTHPVQLPRHEPRGILRVVGRPVVQHQVSLALSLGCTRIVVVAEEPLAELATLRAAAEGGGAQFHVVSSPRALITLIAPEDDLIVLGDGLLALPEEALARLEEGPGVLALPVETALAAGFERIDINNAAAGAMRIPGRIVAGLGDLPGDWNAPAALLRLAMQAGVRIVPLPSELLVSGRWTIVRSEAEALAIEPRWLRLHTAVSHDRSPGEALAAFLVHWLGPAALHAGMRPRILTLGAVSLALLAIGSGWMGLVSLAFLLVALAALIRQTARVLAKVDDSTPPSAKTLRGDDAIFGGLTDALIVALAVWRSELPVVPGLSWFLPLFAPLILTGLLRLLPMLARPAARWPHWAADRSLVGLVLAGISLVAPFDATIMALALLLLAMALLASRSSDQGLVLTSP